MQLNPYLFFNGNCEEAFRYYEKVLGAKIEGMMAHAGSPAEIQVPVEWSKKILHARLSIQGQIIMGSDAPPGHYAKPQGFTLSLQTKDPAEADRLFTVLSDKGFIQMPMQKTFWAIRFGMCVDQFGIPWMVNCD